LNYTLKDRVFYDNQKNKFTPLEITVYFPHEDIADKTNLLYRWISPTSMLKYATNCNMTILNNKGVNIETTSKKMCKHLKDLQRRIDKIEKHVVEDYIDTLSDTIDKQEQQLEDDKYNLEIAKTIFADKYNLEIAKTIFDDKYNLEIAKTIFADNN
jgi:hypothetical protein